MRKERDGSYYIVVPAFVRHDKHVSDGAKLLYGDIAGLTSKHGYCFATNEYLAEVTDKSERTVSRQIAELERQGHIRSEGTDGRRIYLNLSPNMSTPLAGNVQKGVDKNGAHTKTSSTTTTNEGESEHSTTGGLVRFGSVSSTTQRKNGGGVRKRQSKSALARMSDEEWADATGIAGH